jgi:uncharacterized protein (UPF0276 family)
MTPSAGIGFKADHFLDAMASPAAGLWFEVHAENYMLPGGPRLAMLEALRVRRPLSLHGVGLSLAGAADPDRDHLAALKRLVDRFDPFLVSEHIAWSRIGDHCLPDLLPFPRTTEALTRIARNISIVQDALGRQILVENPSHYMPMDGHGWGEVDFLVELARRTGCGLLIDVNNVAVSAFNLDCDATAWLAAVPASAVGEIHLAGHSADAALDLLIDSHGEPIAEGVWSLFADFTARIGPRPTLIERDGNVPPFADFMAERDRAAAVLKTRTPEQAHV